MFETHLHIIPGIDDEAEAIEEALASAKVLVKEGVRIAIVTSHYNDLFPRRSAAVIKERVNGLQQVLDYQGILLCLFSNHAVLIKPGLVEDSQLGRLVTFNGSRYFLLELCNNSWLPETEQVIFELRAYGIRLIIAHLELYPVMQENPARLIILFQQRVLAIVTANSLIGTRSKKIRHYAETLLNKGLIHYVASDAQGLRKRLLGFIGGLQRAVELLDQAQVRRMVETCLEAIINKEACHV
jgi:protein-tyrosine phosphatase